MARQRSGESECPGNAGDRDYSRPERMLTSRDPDRKRNLENPEWLGRSKTGIVPRAAEPTFAAGRVQY
ncbi:MAG: hypothetical protein ACTSRA_08040 [Promethearchaeota archaeon]